MVQNFKQLLMVGIFWVLIAFVNVMSTAWCTLPSEWQAKYDHGVQAYRQGQYQDALQDFEPLVNTVPESAEARYYYAITLAQMGRYSEAHHVYEQVMQLDPNSEAAALAKQGLTYLPESNGMDAPPQFNKVPGENAQMQGRAGKMDPDVMQMMMLMNSMGGNQGAGNLMMMPMLQQMMGQQNGQTSENMMAPEMMKTMMMNQMMQGLDLFGSDKKDD